MRSFFFWPTTSLWKTPRRSPFLTQSPEPQLAQLGLSRFAAAVGIVPLAQLGDLGRSEAGAGCASLRVGSRVVEPDSTSGRVMVGVWTTSMWSLLSLRMPSAVRTSLGTSRVCSTPSTRWTPSGGGAGTVCSVWVDASPGSGTPAMKARNSTRMTRTPTRPATERSVRHREGGGAACSTTGISDSSEWPLGGIKITIGSGGTDEVALSMRSSDQGRKMIARTGSKSNAVVEDRASWRRKCNSGNGLWRTSPERPGNRPGHCRLGTV